MAAYQLEDARVSARGGKSARLSALDGSAVILQTTNALAAPCGPTNFDPHAPFTRMNLNARMEEGETFNYFRDLDTWAVIYFAEISERLFGCCRRSKCSPSTTVASSHQKMDSIHCCTQK